MKKQIVFKGAASALITPMKGGRIDYEAFEKLIKAQINANISALVVGGTTGEAATLDDTERYELFRFAREKAGDRVKLIFGTGTNDTKKAVRHTEIAEECGADAALVVTPYYNKGTETGLISHYQKIAEYTALPIILYNVPKRTGVSLSLHQLEVLAREKNIVAIKEASDSLDRLVELSLFGDDLYIYSGCDSQIHSTLSLGGIGVISVISNLYPELTVKLCNDYFAGNTRSSLKIQQDLLPFINAMFRETNPAPIKYAMSVKGLCENSLRLPLSCASDCLRREIDREMSLLDALEKELLS